MLKPGLEQGYKMWDTQAHLVDQAPNDLNIKIFCGGKPHTSYLGPRLPRLPHHCLPGYPHISMVTFSGHSSYCKVSTMSFRVSISSECTENLKTMPTTGQLGRNT